MSRHPLPCSTPIVALVAALAATLVLAGASGVAVAATRKNATTGKAQTASGTHQRPARVKFIDAPSSETPAARRQRLKRECKGRPNAGMCLGHTR